VTIWVILVTGPDYGDVDTFYGAYGTESLAEKRANEVIDYWDGMAGARVVPYALGSKFPEKDK
jgi:hypothetical protein